MPEVVDDLSGLFAEFRLEIETLILGTDLTDAELFAAVKALVRRTKEKLGARNF